MTDKQPNPPGSVVKTRTPEQQQLKQLEMHEQTKAFAIILEIIVIFALPAILVSVLFNWLEFDRTALYVLLAIAFVFSWWLTIRRVKTVKKRLQAVRTRREAIEDIDEKIQITYEDEEVDD